MIRTGAIMNTNIIIQRRRQGEKRERMIPPPRRFDRYFNPVTTLPHRVHMTMTMTKRAATPPPPPPPPPPPLHESRSIRIPPMRGTRTTTTTTWLWTRPNPTNSKHYGTTPWIAIIPQKRNHPYFPPLMLRILQFLQYPPSVPLVRQRLHHSPTTHHHHIVVVVVIDLSFSMMTMTVWSRRRRQTHQPQMTRPPTTMLIHTVVLYNMKCRRMTRMMMMKPVVDFCYQWTRDMQQCRHCDTRTTITWRWWMMMMSIGKTEMMMLIMSMGRMEITTLIMLILVTVATSIKKRILQKIFHCNDRMCSQL